MIPAKAMWKLQILVLLHGGRSYAVPTEFLDYSRASIIALIKIST